MINNDRAFCTGQPHRTDSFCCSGCMGFCSCDEMHVIPWWNPDHEHFFTTYRCGKCWLSSLDETAAKVADLDNDSRRKFCDFLRGHGADSLADDLMNTSLAEASAILGMIVAKIRAQEISLSA